MTPDEIKKKLQEMGVPLNGWGDTNTGTVKSPILEKQKGALGKIQALLEAQVQQDQEVLSQLHIALQKAKHGGGGTP